MDEIEAVRFSHLFTALRFLLEARRGESADRFYCSNPQEGIPVLILISPGSPPMDMEAFQPFLLHFVG